MREKVITASPGNTAIVHQAGPGFSLNTTECLSGTWAANLQQVQKVTGIRVSSFLKLASKLDRE